MSFKYASLLVLVANCLTAVAQLGRPYYQSVGIDQGLKQGDVLYSPNKQHVLSMTSWTVRTASYNSISNFGPLPLDSTLEGCTNIRPNNVGQVIGNCNGNQKTWGKAFSGKQSQKWVLKIDNSGNVKTAIPATTSAAEYVGNVQSRRIDYWGFQAITGQSPAGGLVPTRGSGTSIYLIDSGISPERDWSQAMSDFDGDRYWINTLNSNVNQNDDCFDYVNHGTYMASIIFNKYSGIAPGTSLYNIKVTHLQTKAYDESDILAAIRKVVNHDTYGGDKIINLSIAYRWPSLAMKCAYQKTYEAGIHIVMAAGDDNVNDAEHYGYVLRVGSVDKTGTPTASTTFGNMLDIWGPGQYVNNIAGTSVSTAYATGVLAAAIEKFPLELGSNPGRAYLYLRDVAQKQVGNSANPFQVQSHPKVANSDYVGKRFLTTRFGSMTPAAGTLFNTSPKRNYCKELSTQAKLAYPPTWGDLTEHLSTRAKPEYVTETWPESRGTVS